MIFEIIAPLIVILVFGLPHGAADGVLAYRLMHTELKRFVLFFILYIALGLLVILVWIIFPLFSLLVFLIISIIHFGIMDTEKSKNQPLRFVRVFVHGSAVILVIPIAHREQVKSIFDLLAFSDTSIIFQLIDIVFYFWLIGVLITSIFPKLGGVRVFLEVGVISILAILLPPLWGFAIYFCIVHSFRHFQNLWLIFGKEYSLKKTISYTLILSIISVCLVLFAAWIITANNPVDGLIRATFIGLAAFTIPHMIFIDTFGAFKEFYQSKIQRSNLNIRL